MSAHYILSQLGFGQMWAHFIWPMSGDPLLVAAQCTNTMHYFTVGSTVSKSKNQNQNEQIKIKCLAINMNQRHTGSGRWTKEIAHFWAAFCPQVQNSWWAKVDNYIEMNQNQMLGNMN